MNHFPGLKSYNTNSNLFVKNRQSSIYDNFPLWILEVVWLARDFYMECVCKLKSVSPLQKLQQRFQEQRYLY
uniref:Uncharacterized protein n=1 Tax=Lepeophtheirus salmonis TaxID=72036 RepID=A0A0K2TEM6_LEPSM